MRNLSLLLVGALMVAPLSSAVSQEATAAGNLSTEATWTALRNLVDAANNQSKIANITANSALDKANKIEACGNRNMIYAPAATDADKETGCKSIPSGSGKDCEFFCIEKYGKHCKSGTVTYKPYRDQKRGIIGFWKTTVVNIPKIWKDKDHYLFRFPGPDNGYVSGQCHDGEIYYFDPSAIGR